MISKSKTMLQVSINKETLKNLETLIKDQEKQTGILLTKSQYVAFLINNQIATKLNFLDKIHKINNNIEYVSEKQNALYIEGLKKLKTMQQVSTIEKVYKINHQDLSEILRGIRKITKSYEPRIIKALKDNGIKTN